MERRKADGKIICRIIPIIRIFLKLPPDAETPSNQVFNYAFKLDSNSFFPADNYWILSASALPSLRLGDVLQRNVRVLQKKSLRLKRNKFRRKTSAINKAIHALEIAPDTTRADNSFRCCLFASANITV